MPFILINQFSFRELIPKIPREDRSVLLICVGVALTFWFILNLTTQDHTINKRVEITYQVSEEEALIEPLTSTAEAVIRGSGWDLLWSSLFQPVIRVQLLRAPEERRDVTAMDISNLIDGALRNNEARLERLTFPTVTLVTAPKKRKRVPLRVAADIQYKNGFFAKSGVQVIPDSIDLLGADILLDSIQEWTTDTLVLENVESSFDQTVPLQTPPQGISLSTKSARLTQQVEVFTEKEFFVPVVVINPPKRDSFTVFPSQVRLTIGVLQSDYPSIVSDSFRLVADLKDIATEDKRNSIPLVLDKKPAAAISVSYTPRAAEFFFFKRE